MRYRNQRKPLGSSGYERQKQYTSHHQRDTNSPVKGSVLLQEDCLDYVNSLSSRKQNLQTCLQLYKVSFDNDLPQKCFPHNNFITLYCEHQCKLLCVNCIYGSAVHKNHRVVPSKNSLKSIARDNQQSIRTLEDELQSIKKSESQLFSNQKVLNQQYKRVLDSIDFQFKEMHRLLQQKYRQMKERAMQSFQRANQNNQIGRQEATWWKNYLGSLRHSLPKTNDSEEAQVYKHLVLETLKKEKLDMEKLTYIASPQQITDQFIRQAIELRNTLEQKILKGVDKQFKQKQRAGRIKLF